MTDADYHSWRKPITLVITAPSGLLSVEWNALQNSQHLSWQRFYISSMLIPLVWVLIVQSMGPSCASEPSLARMSFCSTKQGGCAFWRSGWITFSCLSSLSIQDETLLVLHFLTPLFSASLNSYSLSEWIRRAAEPGWGETLLCIFINRTNSDWSDLSYPFFWFSKQICYKTREAEITQSNAASLACTKTTDQAESQVGGLMFVYTVSWWSICRCFHSAFFQGISVKSYEYWNITLKKRIWWSHFMLQTSTA